MKTLRHYFICDNLDDLDRLHEQLESGGMSPARIHVLSNDEVGVAKHIHLHEVRSLLRRDVINAAVIGAIFGILGAAGLLAVAWLMGLPAGEAGWTPYLFLAIVILGFCTWEGGFFGFQEPNRRYRQFRAALDEGKHVFFVDFDKQQEPTVERLTRQYPGLSLHTMEPGTPGWIMSGYDRFIAFLDRNLLSQSQIH